MCGEPTADIDHAKLYIGLGERRKHVCNSADCPVPLSEISLLRADMEGNAVGVETKIASSTQEFDCHIGGAAEFARQWPLRTLAGNENAAEDLRAGRRAC